MTESPRSVAISVGVVLAREAIDHPWQAFRWRPIDIIIGRPELERGQVLAEQPGQTQFYGGALTIELHRKETSAYLVNLENDPPVVYVVVREAEEPALQGGLEMVVEQVTVSPFEAQDFLDSGEDIVEPLAMPEPLRAWIEGFIAEHHEEETFIKRRRDRVDVSQEKFGQEPLDQIRQRQRQ